MMHHHLTVVLAGTAAHFLTGWLINSDLLLGKIWKNEKEQTNCKTGEKDMRLNIACQFFASMMIAIATCVAIAVFEKAQGPLVAKNALEKLAHLFFNQEHPVKNLMHAIHTVLFIWAGFLLPISAQEVIWCNKSVKHWGLELMAELISLIAIAVTVNFLS